MDPRAILRERGRWTKASILSMLSESPGLSRSDMARRLGLTAQAVSVQVHELLDAELVHDDGGLHPTPAGIEALHGDAEALGQAASGLAAPLAAMDVISAVAAGPIREGQTVGLWMRDGDLVADPDQIGASRGTARAGAAVGGEVLVDAPEGITEHQPGRIQVVIVPEPGDGGIAAATKPPKWSGLVAAVGTGASIMARRLGRLDIPFAGAEGALNAAQRGLDVRLFVSADLVSDALRIIEADRSGIQVRVLETRKER